MNGLCQVGVSFDPASRGVGTSQRLPWSGLRKVGGVTACAGTGSPGGPEEAVPPGGGSLSVGIKEAVCRLFQ